MKIKTKILLVVVMVLLIAVPVGCKGLRAFEPKQGLVVMTNTPKPEPTVVAEGVLTDANLTTAGTYGLVHYTWQLTFDNKRTLALTVQDSYPIFDIGQRCRVLEDPETHARAMELLP